MILENKKDHLMTIKSYNNGDKRTRYEVIHV